MLAAMLAAAATVAGTLPAAMPVAADHEPGHINHKEPVPVPDPPPGDPGTDPPDGDDPPGGPSGPPTCGWEPVWMGPGMEESMRSQFPDAPPDAVFQQYRCMTIGFDLPYTEYRWVPADEAAPIPPSPEEVAEDLWVEVQAWLTSPQVATDPPLGEPALVEVPTFVEVTNWEGPITRGPECVLGVCVELTATPTLRFDPGEDGADTIVCDPPGTRYDPNGAEPDEQAAADGACAHTYQRRTSVAGRPSEWPGEVSITWEASWTGAGDSGTFPSVTFSTDVPRAVQEAPTVVTDLGGDG